MTKPLTYPAPRRMSVELGDGKFYTKPWTRRAANEYKRLAGGHFKRGADHAEASEAAS